jgi:hypothetical protein
LPPPAESVSSDVDAFYAAFARLLWQAWCRRQAPLAKEPDLDV